MTELAREYGDGLYALAQEEKIAADVLPQLETLKQCFKEQPAFLKLLSNMSLSKDKRVGILDGAFRGQIHPYVLNFLKILCERGSLAEFSGCEEAFRIRFNQDNGIIEANVTTAAPLREEQRARMQAKLAQLTGKQVHLNEKVDSRLMGGVLLEMNGQRYDNTIRKRLDSIHQAMISEA